MQNNINNIICIIPARGGSKRIPKKNIKDFFGKPLIAYSIKIAMESNLFDKIIVSTDCEQIAKVALKYGAEIQMRPKELSDDFTGTGDVVKYVIQTLKNDGLRFNYVCTIYATAPLLQKQYLIDGFEKLKNNDVKQTFSATTMPFPIQRTFKITDNGRCQMFMPEHFQTRSQDLEEAYQDAGQFYWENINKEFTDILFGKDSIPIILPRHLVQDIDTLEDWKRAEFMYQILNQNKNILFRTDSSSLIGTGHIMRDLVLAQKYANKNYNITFATQNLKGNINYKILEKSFKLELLESNSLEELNKLIKKLEINMIVIDHYELDYNYEKKLKIENKKLKILTFDDTYEKHYCDILLNHNISADKQKYKNLVPKNCKLKCGAKYTLLRDEFIKEKNKNYKPNKKFTFFIAMGGADTANLNIKILKILKNFQNIKVNLVTTKANQNLEKLKEYCKNRKWIKLYINSTKLAKLMKKSDLAIVTPSVTLNEVYFMDLPFIAIMTANNQKDMYKYLKKNKHNILKKFKKNKFQKILKKFKVTL